MALESSYVNFPVGGGTSPFILLDTIIRYTLTRYDGVKVLEGTWVNGNAYQFSITAKVRLTFTTIFFSFDITSLFSQYIIKPKGFAYEHY